MKNIIIIINQHVLQCLKLIMTFQGEGYSKKLSTLFVFTSIQPFHSRVSASEVPTILKKFF